MPTKEVIGVIGAGTMGAGIAQRFAQEGYSVVLVDQDESKAKAGIDRISNSLAEGVKKGVFSEEDRTTTIQNVRSTADYRQLKNAVCVIEAVFEELDIKKAVFRNLSEATSSKCILATNTSSFKVAELAAVSTHPERVIGLHYFFHPAKNKLVEIIGLPETSPSVLRKAWSLNQVIGKIPIECKDAYGFVVNRFLLPLMNEATRLVEEKQATVDEIDSVTRELLGIGMGPFQLINATGLAVCTHAITTLGNAFGSFYRPTELIKAQFSSKEPWTVSNQPLNVSLEKQTLIRNQLFGGVFLVAGQIVDEGISDQEAVDLGAKTGLLWKKGPFQLMNEWTPKESYAITRTFAKKHGVKVPTCIEEQLGKGSKWSFRNLRWKKDHTTARILFSRPDAMNALNATTLAQLESIIDEVESDSSIETIVLESIGKVFIAGADLKFFHQNLQQKNMGPVKEFIEQGQRVFKKIDQSSKLVIAKLTGSSFGGGTELALSADVIVLAQDATMSLPETGLGIIPGWGGTQRASWYASTEVAKYLTYTGLPLGGKDAVSLALAEYTCPLSEIDDVVFDLSQNANRVSKQHRDACRIPTAFEAAFHLLQHHSVEELFKASFPMPTDPKSQKMVQAIRAKPLSALLAAERAILQGGALRDMNRGLQLEIEMFMKSLESPNAVEGISAFIAKRPPKFV